MQDTIETGGLAPPVGSYLDLAYPSVAYDILVSGSSGAGVNSKLRVAGGSVFLAD